MMVTRYGSGCVGNMSWETPYAEILTQTHGLVRYQSDRIDGERETISDGTLRRKCVEGETIWARIVIRDGRVKRFTHLEIPFSLT